MTNAPLMSTVNLLPWRETAAREARMRLLRQWLMGVTLLVAVVLCGVWQLRSFTESAQAESTSLRSQLAANSASAKAAQTTVNEIARWKGFAALEPTARESHQRALDFLRDLSAQSVAGIALLSLSFNGDVIEVKGTTKSKSLAVDFVRGIKARGWPASAPTVAAIDSQFKEFQFLIKPKAKKK